MATNPTSKRITHDSTTAEGQDAIYMETMAWLRTLSSEDRVAYWEGWKLVEQYNARHFFPGYMVNGGCVARCKAAYHASKADRK